MVDPQSNHTPELDQLLDLRDPLRPTRKLPLELRRLVPNPLSSFEDFERFMFTDLGAMTPAARRAEAFRCRVAIAQVEPDVVPPWVLSRVAALEAA